MTLSNPQRQYQIFENQENREETLPIMVASTGPAEGPAPLGAMASTGTVMTTFEF